MMSLLEGFSDWVMDEVGAQVLPDVASIREKFEARRSQRRGTVDRLIARITGLDLKLEQYHRGERFVSGVAAAAAARQLTRCGAALRTCQASRSSRIREHGWSA